MKPIARLLVEQAGPLTTVQDAGRPGHMRFGVPASGPMDRLAFAAAAKALGRNTTEPMIEVSLGGVTLRCIEGSIAFALCGGDFTATVGGQPIGAWVRGELSPGVTLRVSPGARSHWAYLGFAGAWRTTAWLGSASTHALAGLGGGLLRAGAEIEIAPEQASGGVIAIPRPTHREPPIVTARVVMGPQDHFFAPAEIETFLGASFRISDRFDRMGSTLDGPALSPKSVDMPSEPIVRGALQVDGDGRMTLLQADHQTTGGYPRIGVVIAADVDRIAQLPVGSEIRFAPMTAAEARAAALRERALDRAYLAGVRVPDNLAERLYAHNLISGAVDAFDRPFVEGQGR